MAKKTNLKALDTAALILVIIGAVNWGLVGIANLDLVNLILGKIPILAKLVYIVVGVAGLYMIKDLKKK
jgi:uncharacterized membrane protein YuzA (DUF378 family)